jgi:hypothetical protein
LICRAAETAWRATARGFSADFHRAGISISRGGRSDALTRHPDDDSANRANLENIVLASPILGPIVREWPDIALPDCWLAAGWVAQTVWNSAFGLSLDHGLKDVDLVYFDDTDFSDIGEAGHEERIRHLFARLPAKVDVKNEARVHLWYAEKFGRPISPYVSTTDAIATFPTTATAIGIQPGASGLSIAAPYGRPDLFGLIVRPNKVQITPAIYEAKVVVGDPSGPVSRLSIGKRRRDTIGA